MKKFFVFLLSVSLIGLSVTTQAQDAQANSILDKISRNFKTIKHLKADFSLTMNDAQGKPKDTHKGSFLMKGNKYRVNMAGQQIICDAQNVWTYLPANKEVQVSAYNPAEQTVSPEKLFSGSYNKEYKARYVGVRTVNGKKVEVIELIPIAAAKGLAKVQLFVDKAASMITGGNIFEKNGASYTYTISGLNTSTAVADSEFTFDTKQHPGVEVIDLR